MNEPCMCGALDCRACRGSSAYDPDVESDDDDQRDDYEMRALVDEVFDQVIRGQIGPKEASDKLDAAGVPFDVQCRVLCGARDQMMRSA